jgi:hypothetical protein
VYVELFLSRPAALSWAVSCIVLFSLYGTVLCILMPTYYLLFENQESWAVDARCGTCSLYYCCVQMKFSTIFLSYLQYILLIKYMY